MPHVRFTSHLQKFFPELQQGVRVEGATAAEIVSALDRRYPGLATYVVDERGALRKHVNIFVDQEMVSDRQHLQDAVGQDEVVFIMQALSGG